MNKDEFQEAVKREYDKNHRVEDEDKHDYEWLGLITEEIGEVAKCVNEGKCPILELVQVAMLAEAWVINIRETA